MTESFAGLHAALAQRYSLQHELGRGGMATVYLAEDLKHHRRAGHVLWLRYRVEPREDV